jgi:similar to stage IV sporulation protein
MIEVELASASPEHTLGELSRRNLEMRNIEKTSELTYTCCVSRDSYKIIKEICEKSGDVLRIRKRIGLYWRIKEAFSRPLLLIGGCILLVLVLWLPSRVFFVTVEGNTLIPSRKILEAAENCGITFGASRREVRSERIKNALLLAVPELQWAGVNTSGCTATISVREKEDYRALQKIPEVSSIVAARDGYVLTATGIAGNVLVKPGETVQKGQILISAYTDCGLSLRAERAEGEIMAQTVRKAGVVMPSQYMKKGVKTGIKRKYSLLLRKKRIFLWKDSGIWEGS